MASISTVASIGTTDGLGTIASLGTISGLGTVAGLGAVAGETFDTIMSLGLDTVVGPGDATDHLACKRRNLC